MAGPQRPMQKMFKEAPGYCVGSPKGLSSAHSVVGPPSSWPESNGLGRCEALVAAQEERQMAHSMGPLQGHSSGQLAMLIAAGAC